MKKSYSIGIHVPSVSATGLADGAAYADYFRLVETLGFDAVWVEDRILHPAPLADSLTLLTWAAAHTERLELGTAVLVLNLRPAPLLARQVATLRHLAGDRVTLGVSLGGRANEYAALRQPMDKRVGLFRDGLATLRALLSGDEITRDSTYFPLDGATVRPAGPLPILIGGLAPAAIRRAGELGDGWIMGPFGGLEDIDKGLTEARAGATAAGKVPDQLRIGRLLYVAVDPDRAKAQRDMTVFLHGYYGSDFDVDKHAIIGPAAEVADRLKAQMDAGIGTLMLAPPNLDPSYIRRLADEVLPVLRG